MSSPDSSAPGVLLHAALDRVLVVHAHPDDETITTGATLATLVDVGARVTVVTCTRGELGEVMPDDLAALRDDAAVLAVHREGEIAEAMALLGVGDHRFLGDAGARTAGLPLRPYRDSGMEWGPAGTPVPVAALDPSSFCAAPFSEIVSDLASVVAEVEPSAIISYDSDGGYGHPDHVRVHRAALQAARLAGLPFFAIQSDHDEVPAGPSTAGAAHGAPSAATPAAPSYAAPAPEPSQPTTAVGEPDVVIDGAPVLGRKVAALRAYRTQVAVVDTVDGPALRFPHGVVEPITVVETYRHLAPSAAVDISAAPEMDELGLAGRIVTYLLALVVGGVFGAIGSVSNQTVAGPFPTGLVLSLAAFVTVLVGFRLLFDSRLVPTFAGIGTVVITLLLSLTSAGGSILVPGNTLGYSWIFGAIIASLLVIGWPRLRRASTPPRGPVPRFAGDKMRVSPQEIQFLPDAKEQASP